MGARLRVDLFGLSVLMSAALFMVLLWLAPRALGEPSTIYLLQTVFFGLPLAIICIGASLFARSSRGSDGVAVLLERMGRHPTRVGLFVTVILTLLSFSVFRTYAYTMDEFANVFQAKVFAAGHLAGAWPVELKERMIAPVFDGWFLLTGQTNGAVMSAYWPGLAVLLAPLTLIGLPWLAGPVAGGLTVFLVGRVADLLGGPKAAPVAMLLTMCSAAFIFTATSLLPAGFHLCLNMAFAYLMLKGRRRDLLAAALIGSLALVLHNPVPHMAFAAPWILMAIWRKDRRRTLPALIAGYLPGLLVLFGWPFVWSAALGGGALLSSGDTLGFGVEGLQARALDLVLLWVWAVPALLILAWQGLRSTQDAEVRLLGASLIVTAFAYLFYPHDQGVGYGARYLHSAFGALPVIAAVFLTKADPRHLTGAVRGAILYALLAIPVVGGLMSAAMVGPALAIVPGAEHRGPAIVRFISGIGPTESGARDGMVRNEPFADGLHPPLVLISAGEEADRAFMFEHFPGSRRIEVTEFGSAYEVP